MLRKKWSNKLNFIFAGFVERIHYCILESKNGSSPRMLYNVLLFLIPLISIIGCYSAIYLKVRNGQKNLLALLSSNSDSDDLRKSVEKTNSQLFRMIMVIGACFVIFIVPKLALKIITRTVSSISVSDLANLDRVVTVLVFLNSIVNPFVYYFTNKSFREAFIQILPTKLRNIVIKGPSVERKQDPKSCGNQTHLSLHTISSNTVTNQFWICCMNYYLFDCWDILATKFWILNFHINTFW